MTILDVTFIYEDGSMWYAGVFHSQAALDVWVTTEKAQPYWKASTKVSIVDKSTPVQSEERRDKARDAGESDQHKAEDLGLTDKPKVKGA